MNATTTRIAATGHLMTYRIVGHYEDGTPRTSQLDAEHSAKCPCASRDED